MPLENRDSSGLCANDYCSEPLEPFNTPDMRPLTEKEVIQKLAALCARSEHCAHEMREKMRRWEVEDTVQERVITYLQEHQYIDEERFCRAFVKDKLTYNRWGRRKVEQALYAKRISSEVQRRVLDEVADTDYAEKLRPLLEAKAKSIKAENDYERRTKLIRFALGRGFTMDVILDVVDSLS